MIEYLRIERWRAYEHLELELGAGTTFVVARNGIGKTSLVEAARFAATGAIDSSQVVRAGAKDAEVEVRLRLADGSTLTIVRRLVPAQRKPEVSTEADLDGVHVEGDLGSLLERNWRASLGFVSRTAFIHESLHHSRTEGVRDQLARAFGVGALRAALAELDARVSEFTKRTAAADKEVREDTSDRAALVRAVEAAEAEASSVAAAREAARSSFERTEAQERDFLAAQQQTELHGAWVRRRDELLAEVQSLVGRPVPAQQLALVVRELESDSLASLEQLRSEASALRTRLDIGTAAADELGGAGAICPVCLRPLDDATRMAAMARHQADLTDLGTRLAALSEEDLLEGTVRARGISDRLLALGAEPPMPAIAPSSQPEDAASIRLEWQAAVEAAAVAQASVNRAQANLSVLDANAARVTDLLSLYRELALLEVTRAAAEATIHRVLQERVDPLLQVVRARWKRLFPDRPDIHLDVDGEFRRSVGGVDLPFDAFSTGERAAAQLLLRLVLVEATTNVGTCWIDEPLEHLDPTSRRLVGGMLAQASRSGDHNSALRLRQLLVTTYEEPLARRIAGSVPGTNLIYVAAQPAE